jgi:hypothetical protein
MPDDVAARLRALLSELDRIRPDAGRLPPCQRHCLAALESAGRPMQGAAVWAYLARTLPRPEPYSLGSVYRALGDLVRRGLVSNDGDRIGYTSLRTVRHRSSMNAD